MNFLNLMTGVLLIAWGRNMFWLFVAWLGFATGFELTQSLIGTEGPTPLILALLVGIVGAMIAIFLEKAAIGLAGFFAGGYLCFQLAGIYLPEYSLIATAAGALTGMLIMYVVFDGALIFLTSLAGATLVVSSLNLSQGLYLASLVVVTFAGIFLQTNIPHLPGQPRRPRPA